MKGMNLNGPSSDYLTYKKSKMNPTRVQRVEKRIEKVKRIFKLSLVTFCIMFICVVVFIKKYAKRVDIEYGRHGMETVSQNNAQGSQDGYFNDTYDPDKRTIDKRLILIQEEENAPSESRVLPQDRDKNEVMNLEHFEKLQSDNLEDIDEAFEEEPQPKPAAPAQKPAVSSNPANLMPKIQRTEGETSGVEAIPQGNLAPIELAPKSDIKVLIGRYPTFDEAKTAQNTVKNTKAMTPSIRRVGSVYSLQVGSYTSMDTARVVAGKYGSEGYDVWIYQP